MSEHLPDTLYPYTEFEDHFNGFFDALDAEDSAFAAAGMKVEKGFFRSAMFLKDFMESQESDPLARSRKSLMLFQVSSYIIDNAEALDVGHHLVRGDSSILFSGYLVKAIFTLFFPDEVYRAVLDPPNPEAVLRLAEELKQREDESDAAT